VVTKDLERAFDQASKLPAGEQEQLAAWIIQELKAEREWSHSLAASGDGLAQLADEALSEHVQGTTESLDPDAL
jgi:hypothetical protein